MTDSIVQAALSEIAAPQFGTTEQILAVHTLTATAGVVQPVSIEPVANESSYRVYFAIADEPYFFVVVVFAGALPLQATASYIEASVQVYLAIYSPTLDPDTITQRIGIAPSRAKTKGDPMVAARRPTLVAADSPESWRFCDADALEGYPDL